ncbi:hypothetical protein [Butyrivibrio sp. VCB2006]|uniref:hypothetical protein n=1 Tax=Butyrivibrio sp. VCB2006 TaxID=1280679 RepID=UPI0012DC021D|nr:hypothetical protein [Butyrivibrio sp. VCB2006]
MHLYIKDENEDTWDDRHLRFLLGKKHRSGVRMILLVSEYYNCKCCKQAAYNSRCRRDHNDLFFDSRYVKVFVMYPYGIYDLWGILVIVTG